MFQRRRLRIFIQDSRYKQSTVDAQKYEKRTWCPPPQTVQRNGSRHKYGHVTIIASQLHTTLRVTMGNVEGMSNTLKVLLGKLSLIKALQSTLAAITLTWPHSVVMRSSQ